MVYKKDTTLGQTKEFDAQIQVLDIPNEINWLLPNWFRAMWTFRLPYCQAQVEDGQGDWWQEDGGSPIGFVRCGRSACRIAKLKWKMGKETGGKKMEDPHSLKSNEMAQC